MMGGAFVIGFSVAYLIKIISLMLSYFEKFSLTETIAIHKRYSRIHKIRERNIKCSWITLQKKVKSEMLDYHYPYTPENADKNENPNENEIIRYYYGNC